MSYFEYQSFFDVFWPNLMMLPQFTNHNCMSHEVQEKGSGPKLTHCLELMGLKDQVYLCIVA